MKALGLTLRGFDEANNEIVPQDVRFKVSGGAIDFGGEEVPHLGRLVQGVFKGRVKGGQFVQVDSRWQLIVTIAVEAASAREIPDEDVDGTIQQAAADAGSPPTAADLRRREGLAAIGEGGKPTRASRPRAAARRLQSVTEAEPGE